MAVPGWYNQNRNRAYPFITGTISAEESGPLTLRNLSNAVILDAGFAANSKSGFEIGEHTVRLKQIRRSSDTFYFDFVSDAPGLQSVLLTFTRHLTDDDPTGEFRDSGEEGLSAVSLSESDSVDIQLCDDPLWSGFLVTGSMETLALYLAGDGVLLAISNDDCVIEPALVQSLAKTCVTQFALANDDRTRVTAPADCDEVVFPYPIDVTHINNRCLQGSIAFRAGYNAIVRQSANAIVFAAAAGAGAGEPCQEVQLFHGERPPSGSTLLSGGFRCNEVLRSINGQGGKAFSITAGQGVLVTSNTSTHTITIDVDLRGMAMQYFVSSISESC